MTPEISAPMVPAVTIDRPPPVRMIDVPLFDLAGDAGALTSRQRNHIQAICAP